MLWKVSNSMKVMENVILECHLICTSMHLPSRSAGSLYVNAMFKLVLYKQGMFFHVYLSTLQLISITY